MAQGSGAVSSHQMTTVLWSIDQEGFFCLFVFVFPPSRSKAFGGTLALLLATNAKWVIIGLRSSWDVSGAAGRKAGSGTEMTN